MLIAIGNTYSAKEDLKSCGMTWDKENKVWSCKKENFDFDRWDNKMCSLTWNGRKQGTICNAVKFEEK